MNKKLKYNVKLIITECKFLKNLPWKYKFNKNLSKESIDFISNDLKTLDYIDESILIITKV